MTNFSCQRRSIPSVFIDNTMDSHHLTLKDCFSRRGSTGRALPKVPIEQVIFCLVFNLKLLSFYFFNNLKLIKW